MTQILQDYKAYDVTSEAFVAFEKKEKSPAVLICHAWAGQGSFEQNIARKLAKLGYVGIALDVYGKGKRGTTIEENSALMTPLVSDKATLIKRLMAGVEFAKTLSQVDNSKIAIIGFCFGGLCALDVARTGTDEVKAAISFHGFLTSEGVEANGDIKAKVLALHGYEDPLAPQDHMHKFCEEMEERNADWQLHAFGKTKHAFTNPLAANPELGLVYNELSANRSWVIAMEHLKETFV